MKQFSNYIDYIYENVEEHNPFKEQKLLIVFDDMIADKLSNTKKSTNSNRNVS